MAGTFRLEDAVMTTLGAGLHPLSATKFFAAGAAALGNYPDHDL